MFWAKIDGIAGEVIPMCIKKILSSCGYDTLLSLQNISLETVNRIERHINEHFIDIIQEFDCCHQEYYKEQTIFKFLPGHSDFLIALSRKLSTCEPCCEPTCESKYESFDIIRAVEDHPSLSLILKEMIKTALRNGIDVKKHAQYADIIRYFATYIFIIGGRSCYEVLYKNLPLPSVSTVRKY